MLGHYLLSEIDSCVWFAAQKKQHNNFLDFQEMCFWLWKIITSDFLCWCFCAQIRMPLNKLKKKQPSQSETFIWGKINIKNIFGLNWNKLLEDKLTKGVRNFELTQRNSALKIWVIEMGKVLNLYICTSKDFFKLWYDKTLAAGFEWIITEKLTLIHNSSED